MIQVAIQVGIYIDHIFFPNQYKIIRFTHQDIQKVYQSKAFTNLLNNVDYLICRSNIQISDSITVVCPNLRGIGIVSTGLDNVQLSSQCNIPIVSKAGLNAQAVCDYVMQALLHYWLKFDIAKTKVGIIGYGHIGKQIPSLLSQMQVSHKIYDPYIQIGQTLEDLHDCSILSFHIPLTYKNTDKYATYQMLNQTYYQNFSKQPLIIQTSRGKIWEPNFYKYVIHHDLIWAQDVYPNEPNLSPSNINSSFMTPHIAGYSTKGRLLNLHYILENLLDNITVPKNLPTSIPWSIEEESTLFKKNISVFQNRRDHFIWRKEFHEYTSIEQKSIYKQFPKIPKEILNCIFEQVPLKI